MFFNFLIHFFDSDLKKNLVTCFDKFFSQVSRFIVSFSRKEAVSNAFVSEVRSVFMFGLGLTSTFCEFFIISLSEEAELELVNPTPESSLILSAAAVIRLTCRITAWISRISTGCLVFFEG